MDRRQPAGERRRSGEQDGWTRTAVRGLAARQHYFDTHERLVTVPRLTDMNQDLMKKAAKLLGAMQAAGFPMLITDGLRTLDEQQALYAKGRTVPGQIVTYADGVNNRSNHQAHPDDGLGHALDCTFFNPANAKPWWPVDAQWMKCWRAYGKLAVALGLEWGGDWKHPDVPHIQLP